MQFATTLLLAGLASATNNFRTDFMQHITEHGLSYGTVEEYEFRFQRFLETQAFIEEHNAIEENTYTVAHNKMSTWTAAERKRLRGYVAEIEDGSSMVPTLSFPNVTIATSIDWRAKGAVNPIKDQAYCGSCWAFASVAALEAAHKIKSGTLLSLSEQQLVDCNTSVGGCNGGNTTSSYAYWETHRAESEAAYPYTAKDGTCKYSSTAATAVQVSSYSRITGSSVTDLKTALNTGVVDVAVDAESSAWNNYSSGVFNNSTCGTSLDHAVVLVGYGTDATYGDYWILRNSWGTGWGEKGYMRLKIVSGQGICGV